MLVRFRACSIIVIVIVIVTGCDVDGCVSQMTIIHTLYVIYNMQ